MTLFADSFGAAARARLLDFLGDHPTSDSNVTELAQKAGGDPADRVRRLADLEKVGLVRHTRGVGQSRMYAPNMEHPVAQSVLRADMRAQRGARKAVLAH